MDFFWDDDDFVQKLLSMREQNYRENLKSSESYVKSYSGSLRIIKWWHTFFSTPKSFWVPVFAFSFFSIVRIQLFPYFVWSLHINCSKLKYNKKNQTKPNQTENEYQKHLIDIAPFNYLVEQIEKRYQEINAYY